jgi:hypothetical protein
MDTSLNKDFSDPKNTEKILGEISGSHGDEYKDDYLLGCCAV